MIRIFERRAAREAEIYAEAQALLDDGLELPFVLGLFAEDESWLAPLLHTSQGLASAIEAEEPSYYFEASLKNRFLAAAREQRTVAVPAPPIRTNLFTTAASVGVTAAVGVIGVLTFGFVTADQADPGDWNYGFKQTQERVQYALARGNEKVDVQLRQTESRVWEIRRQQDRGGLSAADIERLQREAQALAELARVQQFDDVQRARLNLISETISPILEEARVRKPELGPVVATTRSAVDEAVAASAGPTAAVTLPEVPPQASATSPAASASPTGEPSATPEPSATAVPSTTATATAEPSTTATVEPSATASPSPGASPSPSPTPAPSETPSPSPTAGNETPTVAPSETVTPSQTPTP